MNNDENWNREEDLMRYFDPNDITEWLKYSPEEFIAVMINEIRQENLNIGNWSRLLDENP